MNERWFVYYGLKLGMTKKETMLTGYGEMLDLIDCMAIDNGAEQKEPEKDILDVLRMK